MKVLFSATIKLGILSQVLQQNISSLQLSVLAMQQGLIHRHKVKKRAELGLTSWAAAAAVAKNRDRWRALMSGPIPHQGARN